MIPLKAVIKVTDFFCLRYHLWHEYRSILSIHFQPTVSFSHIIVIIDTFSRVVPHDWRHHNISGVSPLATLLQTQDSKWDHYWQRVTIYERYTYSICQPGGYYGRFIDPLFKKIKRDSWTGQQRSQSANPKCNHTNGLVISKWWRKCSTHMSNGLFAHIQILSCLVASLSEYWISHVRTRITKNKTLTFQHGITWTI